MKKIDKVASYWYRNLSGDVGLAPGEEVFSPKLLELAKKSSKILEIGVGKGRMVNVLRNGGVISEFHGIDITENVTDSETIGVIGDARALPYPDNTFDLVYSLGVIEHFPETYESVLEQARVVKKGGHVLITTPHLSIFTPLRYLVYLIKDRRHGSFEEVKGRNIGLNTMKNIFINANLFIQDYGVFGIYGIGKVIRKLDPKFCRIQGNNFLQKIHQETYIGAYLYIIGKKQ